MKELAAHRDACWYCACYSYSSALDGLFLEWLQLQTTVLKFVAAVINHGATEEIEAHREDVVSSQVQCYRSWRAAFIRFIESPEEFLSITKKPNPIDLLSDPILNVGADVMKRYRIHDASRREVGEKLLFAPSSEFQSLFVALLQGLRFVSEIRRPIDIPASPISVSTIDQTISATEALDSDLPQRVTTWFSCVGKLGQQVRDLRRLHDHRKRMGIGAIFSPELSVHFQELIRNGQTVSRVSNNHASNHGRVLNEDSTSAELVSFVEISKRLTKCGYPISRKRLANLYTDPATRERWGPHEGKKRNAFLFNWSRLVPILSEEFGSELKTPLK